MTEIASLVLLVGVALQAAGQSTNPATDPSVPPLETVVVSAPEPRYVAPTLRDRIGRIWAPVYLIDKGPFRLVLDTGAPQLVGERARDLGEPGYDPVYGYGLIE